MKKKMMIFIYVQRDTSERAPGTSRRVLGRAKLRYYIQSTIYREGLKPQGEKDPSYK
jgi:hypothetical protein